MEAGASLAALRQQFEQAAEPDLRQVLGLHQAQYLGPLWLRVGGPLGVAVLGMPGWAGKRFPAGGQAGPTVSGWNMRRHRGHLVESLPMTARVEASITDERAAIVATYAADSPWPWRGVRDELRPVSADTLLGLSFGLPLFSAGLPFLLVRRG